MAAARRLIEQHRISKRSAYQLVGIFRSVFRLGPGQDDRLLRARLIELGAQQSARGYLFLHSMLETEGLVINRKRPFWIYTEEMLQVRTKRHNTQRRPPQPYEVPGVNDQLI
tara:strand:+ start:750 stop:1085 length:336 start_codon:yes stop_codon:yes gene_type:complete